MIHFIQLIQNLGRSENFQTNSFRLILYAYCVKPEPRVKLLLIATRPYSVMLDACALITALMKPPENNFQLVVGRWKFNFWLFVFPTKNQGQIHYFQNFLVTKYLRTA